MYNLARPLLDEGCRVAPLTPQLNDLMDQEDQVEEVSVSYRRLSNERHGLLPCRWNGMMKSCRGLYITRSIGPSVTDRRFISRLDLADINAVESIKA